jgi:hypothetical protein
VSDDVFVQRFEDGDAAPPSPGDEARALLLGLAEGDEAEDGFAMLRKGAAQTDVYGIPAPGEEFEGLMFNQTNRPGFDLIVLVARELDAVILPVDGPTCLTAESQRRHLPPDLAEMQEAVLVESGEALALAIGVE